MGVKRHLLDQSIGNFFERPPGHPRSPPRDQSIKRLFKQKRGGAAATRDSTKAEPSTTTNTSTETTISDRTPTSAGGSARVREFSSDEAVERDTSSGGAEGNTGMALKPLRADAVAGATRDSVGPKRQGQAAKSGSEVSRKKRRIIDSDEEEGSGEEQTDGHKDGKAGVNDAENGQTACAKAAVKKEASQPEAVKEEHGGGTSKRATKATTNSAGSKPTKDLHAMMMGKAKAKSSSAAVKNEAQASASRDGAASDASDDDEAEAKAEEEEEEKEEKAEQQARKKLASIFLKPGKDSDVDVGAKWSAGQPVPYAALAATFGAIEKTTKRLEILEILTKFFVRVIQTSPDNLLQTVYLCINRLCPDYEGLELGIGESILLKAIAQSTGRDMKVIKKDLEAKGDLGLVAIGSRQKQPTMFKAAALTVPFVFKALKEIAAMSGQKSQDRKIGGIKKLLAASVGEEPKYLMRSLEGKLRIGLAEKTVVVALAQSVVLARAKKSGKHPAPEKLQEELDRGTATVKAVFSELPNYDAVVPALLEGGPEHCRKVCQLTPGIPLKPMLAKPTKAITEVLDRFEGKPFTCEYKYDGERAQVHYYLQPPAATTAAAVVGGTGGSGEGAGAQAASRKPTLAVFSRNSENMSVKYPDLVEQVPRCVREGVTSFVLDAEATAWKREERDEKTGQVYEARMLPFQELSRRKRKDVKAEDIVVHVKLFAFDLLYLNGEPLLNRDLAERRKLLREHFQPVENEFDFGHAQDCTTVDEIQTFLDESVKAGCEGLMVKMLEGQDATYEPSRRSMNWLKLKKDYLAGTGDSLDLVVIGGYHGKGKRTNVYGAFLLACYDADNEAYQAICKIGTGFSEADLEAHHQTLKPLEIVSKKGYYDVGGATPDVYFEPKVLWEVLAADLSLSPVYTAARGIVDQRGISLRFPRYLRTRDDKDPEDATGPEQVADMYRKQAVVGSRRNGLASANGADGVDADDDFW